MGNETIGMMFLVLKDIAWLVTTVKDDMTTGKLLVEQMVLKENQTYCTKLKSNDSRQDLLLLVVVVGIMVVVQPHKHGR